MALSNIRFIICFLDAVLLEEHLLNLSPKKHHFLLHFQFLQNNKTDVLTSYCLTTSKCKVNNNFKIKKNQIYYMKSFISTLQNDAISSKHNDYTYLIPSSLFFLNLIFSSHCYKFSMHIHVLWLFYYKLKKSQSIPTNRIISIKRVNYLRDICVHIWFNFALSP